MKLLQSSGAASATPMRQFDEFERVKVEMTDITDASFFHVRLNDKDNFGQKIDAAMAKFDAKSAEDLERPIKKGTLCAA